MTDWYQKGHIKNKNQDQKNNNKTKCHTLIGQILWKETQTRVTYQADTSELLQTHPQAVLLPLNVPTSSSSVRYFSSQRPDWSSLSQGQYSPSASRGRQSPENNPPHTSTHSGQADMEGQKSRGKRWGGGGRRKTTDVEDEENNVWNRDTTDETDF